jgi:hypothetical protein
VALTGSDDPVLAALAARPGRPDRTPAATLRERLGLARPESRHALTTA